MKKIYSASPLPFQGQKRRFLSEFKRALNEFPNATCFVDLFGGSGLLSHTAKRYRPDARVIYNDFDDYHLRLANIGRTNMLLDELRGIVSGVPAKQKLPKDVKDSVVSRVKIEEKEYGYVDYIILSSSLLFSMNYAKDIKSFEKETFYNKIITGEYTCDDYLDGIEVVKSDYLDLFNKYKNMPDVVFIVDPPYLSTDVSTYGCNYWRLSDYLNVLNVLDGTSYIYFTSNKSCVLELCEWFDKSKYLGNPFDEAKCVTLTAKISPNKATYKDIMLYKKVG